MPSLRGWRRVLDKRTGLSPILQAAALHEVPSGLRYYHYFGAVLILLFLVQGFTGVLMLFYYQPTPEAAHRSVRFLMNEVSLGWVVRSLHRWAGDGMVVVAFLHLFRVFLTGAFKAPRELTWMVGSLLLFGVLGLAFTGYLLPWDEKAYWATTVGTRMVREVPLLGPFLEGLLAGGERVGALTLTRFFALHIVVIPFLLLFLMGVHLFLIYRLGIADPLPRRGNPPAGRVPYFSDFFQGEIAAGLVALALLLLWTAWSPAPLGSPADPNRTPGLIKPDWPFLAFYQMLKYFPSGGLFPGLTFLKLAVLLQMVPFLLLLLLPFLDRSPDRRPGRRKVVCGAGLSLLLAWAILTYLGHYAGGRDPLFGVAIP